MANPTWSHEYKPHYEGAHQKYSQTSPTCGRLSPAKCSDCDNLQVEVAMTTCRVTKSDLLAEPSAMPVDSEQLHKAEHRRSWQRKLCVRRQLLKLTVGRMAFLILTCWMALTGRASGHNHVSNSAHPSHRLPVPLMRVQCRDSH